MNLDNYFAENNIFRSGQDGQRDLNTHLSKENHIRKDEQFDLELIPRRTNGNYISEQGNGHVFEKLSSENITLRADHGGHGESICRNTFYDQNLYENGLDGLISENDNFRSNLGDINANPISTRKNKDDLNEYVQEDAICRSDQNVIKQKKEDGIRAANIPRGRRNIVNQMQKCKNTVTRADRLSHHGKQQSKSSMEELQKSWVSNWNDISEARHLLNKMKSISFQNLRPISIGREEDRRNSFPMTRMGTTEEDNVDEYFPEESIFRLDKGGNSGEDSRSSDEYLSGSNLRKKIAKRQRCDNSIKQNDKENNFHEGQLMPLINTSRPTAASQPRRLIDKIKSISLQNVRSTSAMGSEEERRNSMPMTRIGTMEEDNIDEYFPEDSIFRSVQGGQSDKEGTHSGEYLSRSNLRKKVAERQKCNASMKQKDTQTNFHERQSMLLNNSSQHLLASREKQVPQSRSLINKIKSVSLQNVCSTTITTDRAQDRRNSMPMTRMGTTAEDNIDEYFPENSIFRSEQGEQCDEDDSHSDEYLLGRERQKVEEHHSCGTTVTRNDTQNSINKEQSMPLIHSSHNSFVSKQKRVSQPRSLLDKIKSISLQNLRSTSITPGVGEERRNSLPMTRIGAVKEESIEENFPDDSILKSDEGVNSNKESNICSETNKSRRCEFAKRQKCGFIAKMKDITLQNSRTRSDHMSREENSRSNHISREEERRICLPMTKLGAVSDKVGNIALNGTFDLMFNIDGIVSNMDGSCWVLSRNEPTLLRIAPNGQVREIIHIPAYVIDDLTVDPDGNIYFSCSQQKQIMRLDANRRVSKIYAH